jgi:hypothetical protein
MTNLDHILICEGVQDPPGETPEEQEAAYYESWQHLINTGLAFSLQGWFGREAMNLIEQGFCTIAQPPRLDLSKVT